MFIFFLFKKILLKLNYKNHNENLAILEKGRDDFSVALSKKQEILFDALKSIFKTDFSANLYKGYISIFDCNPRFVETKDFQVFYKRSIENKLAVVFHEILHFAFFDYCDTNFSEKVKNLDKNSGKFWELSEIFNIIVLNTEPFINITNQEEKLFYPQLAEKLEQAKIVLDRVNGDVKEFIEILLS